MRGARFDLTIALLAVAMGLTVAGCGYATATSAGTGATSTVTTVTPVLCPTPTAGASAMRSDGHLARTAQRVVPITTLPPGVTPSQVRVVVEGDRHGPCETILVWAGNGLNERIYTTDHHSDCTIVTLQRQVNTEWQPVAACLLASPTRIIEIAPMQANFVQLAPGALGTQERAWPTGTYRVAFGYHTGQQVSATTDTLVYSTIFSIA